jgi:SAM-dependent methyltransferase
MEGLDLNYESEHVRRGSILHMPYDNGVFDMVLLLDVLEHLTYTEQPVALAEIRRILKADGTFLASIPNLAHLNSRFRMVVRGELDRTDVDINHVGERPFQENKILLQKAGFRIIDVKGITLTIPFLYRNLICRRPATFRWLHDLFEPLAFPRLAMINLFVCRKSK